MKRRAKPVLPPETTASGPHDYIEPYYRELGERIASARVERGLTQAALAGSIGVQRPTIANIETAKQRVLAHQVAAIAQVLGCGPADLLPPMKGQFERELERRLAEATPAEARRIRQALRVTP